MHPIKFKESNCTYAKNQKEYLPLPAYKNKDGVVSCWKLSLLERIKILLKGKFYFSVYTFNKPLQPQRPFIENPVKYYE